MPACPYCQFEISEEYNFCLNCDSQVKCTQCAKLLIPGKTRCFVCGNLLISKELPQTQMNEFTLEEEQTTKSASRRINARLSDDAFGQAASLFGGMPSARLVPQTTRATPPPLQKLLPIPEDNQEEVVEQVVEGSYSVDQSTTYQVMTMIKIKPYDFLKPMVRMSLSLNLLTIRESQRRNSNSVLLLCTCGLTNIFLVGLSLLRNI